MRKGPGALVVVGASATGTSVTGAADVTLLPSLEQAVTPNRPRRAIPNGRVKLFMISLYHAAYRPYVVPARATSKSVTVHPSE